LAESRTWPERRNREALAVVTEHQLPDTSDGDARVARLEAAQAREDQVAMISGRKPRRFVDSEPFEPGCKVKYRES
jgi:hypothetical protein